MHDLGEGGRLRVLHLLRSHDEDLETRRMTNDRRGRLAVSLQSREARSERTAGRWSSKQHGSQRYIFKKYHKIIRVWLISVPEHSQVYQCLSIRVFNSDDGIIADGAMTER